MKRTRLTTYLFGLILSLLVINGLQFSYANDTKRRVSQEKLEALQSDSDFNYARNYRVQDDPLAKLLNWIRSKFFQAIGKATSGGWQRIVALIIIGLIITYAVLKLLDIDPTFGLLFSNKKNSFNPTSGAIIDDIKGTDFQSFINQAYANKNYRDVVRYYYLFALNRLDAAEIIRWKKGKTNLEYLYEVENENIKSHFSSLNFYFEYAVYGEFEITESLAKSSEALFHQINESI